MKIAPRAFGLIISLCSATIIGVNAIQENLAGVVDWHKAQVGVALLAPTPPRIVTLPGAQGQGLVLSITESNVLAAVQEETGEIGV